MNIHKGNNVALATRFRKRFNIKYGITRRFGCQSIIYQTYQEVVSYIVVLFG